MFTSAKVSFSSTFGAWPSTSQELFHLITQHHAIYSEGRAKAAQDVRHGACGNCRPSSFFDRLVGSDATADAWAAASDLLSPEHDNSRLSNPWPKTSGLREPRQQAIRTSASWVSVGLWSTRPGFCIHPTPCYGRGLRWRSVFFFFKRGRWCRRGGRRYCGRTALDDTVGRQVRRVLLVFLCSQTIRPRPRRCAQRC